MADAGNRMYCHSCEGVWSQDGSGLTCPHCHSDFTEIVRAHAPCLFVDLISFVIYLGLTAILRHR